MQQVAVHQQHRNKKKRHQRRDQKKSHRAHRVEETRASEALTVGWGVTVTTVVVCNLATIGAHYYVSQHPEALRMAILGELLLFGAAVVGMISLVLLPFLYRVRRVPPPHGVAVFGACVAAAPILGLLVKAVR